MALLALLVPPPPWDPKEEEGRPKISKYKNYQIGSPSFYRRWSSSSSVGSLGGGGKTEKISKYKNYQIGSPSFYRRWSSSSSVGSLGGGGKTEKISKYKNYQIGSLSFYRRWSSPSSVGSLGGGGKTDVEVPPPPPPKIFIKNQNAFWFLMKIFQWFFKGTKFLKFFVPSDTWKFFHSSSSYGYIGGGGIFIEKFLSVRRHENFQKFRAFLYL